MLAAEDLTASVTAFSEHARWTGVRSEDRAAWLDLRRTLITASDVPAIMGYDPHRDALAVYYDKLTPPANDSLELSDPRFWGSVLEQPILRAVADHYGWEYRPGGALLQSRRWPHLGATLDAEIDRGDGIGWIDFEGKTSVITRDWDEEAGSLPMRVLVQAQTQLLVTGAPKALVFALLQGSRPCRVEIEPSPEFFAIIVEETERFIDLVNRGEAPPATAKSKETLRRMHPTDDGSVIMLSDEDVARSRELVELNRQLKALEARKDELRNLLQQSLGSATYGILPEEVEGKRAWKFALEQRAPYQVEATEFRALRAVKNVPNAVPAPVVQRVEIEDEGDAPAGNVVRFKQGRRRARR